MSDLNKVGTHGVVFYWTVVEMLTFTDGTFWGKVLYTGNEQDCEQWLNARMKDEGPRWYALAYPRGLGEKVVKSLEYNIIATSKPPTVYKQTPVNIPKLS